MLTSKVDKEIRIGWNKRRGIVSVLREHYLRDDIPCRIQECRLCRQELSDVHCMLTPDLSHYVLPDVSVVERFHEVLEYPQIRGIIITQTASDNLRYSVGHRTFSRFMKSLSVPVKSSVHFSNEHQQETFTEQLPDQSITEWEEQLTIRAAVWYYRHIEMLGLSDKVSLILITEDRQDYTEILSTCPSVKILSLHDYLELYYTPDNTVHELYQSILAVQTERHYKQERPSTGYTEYFQEKRLYEEIEKCTLIAGKLRVSKHHPKTEAFVTALHSTLYTDVISEPITVQDILIYGEDRNRSLTGDTVAVQLLPKSDWKGASRQLPTGHTPNLSPDDESRDNTRPTGRVVGILNRPTRDIVATFPEGVSVSDRFERILVIPYDVRLPKIRINTRLASQLKNQRIVVRIDNWDIHSQYPNGHFVRSIGSIGDIETETQSILIEHELCTGSFSQSVLSELPDGEEWSIEDEEMEKRRDLRSSHLVYSIDPKGCEDVDDTLSVKLLRKGCIELAVHIADVSHFVKAGSYTDREAKERSTTVYLADRRYDMLPPVLSANLCSLLSNVDRYAVSVMWRLNPQFEVEKVWYGRTIIRSSYKLTYEVAQDLFEDKDDSNIIPSIQELHNLTPHEAEKRINDLRWSVKQLVKIGRVLRERRNNEGALELEGVEVKIQMTDKGNIGDIIPKQPLEMHETVAECMIFANHWVAKETSKHLTTNALLRNHTGPPPSQFSSLLQCASSRGYSINTDSNIKLAQSLDNAVDQSDPQVNKILRMLATHAMIQALYISTGSTNQLSHYGLGLNLYTHFTSPIRRYADLLVHRQLLSVVGEGRSEDILPTDSELQEICEHMNEKKRSSARAQLASTALFQGLYFLNNTRTDTVTEAVVYRIRTNGVMAYAPRYGIQSPVYLKDKNGLVISTDHNDTLHWTEGSLTYTDDSIAVASLHSQFCIKLFDHILVKIKVDSTSQAHPLTISLELSSTTPIKPVTDSGGEKQTTENIIKVLRSEEKVKYDKDIAESSSEEYKQQDNTLYVIIKKMHNIGITKF